jgi:hypothetical protein
MDPLEILEILEVFSTEGGEGPPSAELSREEKAQARAKYDVKSAKARTEANRVKEEFKRI